MLLLSHYFLEHFVENRTLQRFCKVVGSRFRRGNIDNVHCTVLDIVRDPEFPDLDEPGGLCGRPTFRE